MDKDSAKEALRTFKELLDDGLITHEDYEAKKSEVLAMLSQSLTSKEAAFAQSSSNLRRASVPDAGNQAKPPPPLVKANSHSVLPNTPGNGFNPLANANTSSNNNRASINNANQSSRALSSAPSSSNVNSTSSAKSTKVTPSNTLTSSQSRGAIAELEQQLAEILGEPVPWGEKQGPAKATTPPLPSSASSSNLNTPVQHFSTITPETREKYQNLQNVATLSGHTGYVFSLAVHEGLLFSASADKTIKAWDLQTLKVHSTLGEHENTVCALAKNDKYLFSGSWDNTIKIWELSSLKCISTLRGHNNYVSSLAISKKYLYSGSWDHTIQIWDVESKKSVATILKEHTDGKVTGGHTNCISALTVTPTGTLISGSYDNTIKIWGSDHRCRKTLMGHSNWIYCLATDGTRIFSGSRDNTIKVWDLQTGTMINSIGGHTDYVTSLAIADGVLVSGSMDHSIRSWDLHTFENISVHKSHTNSVHSLVFAYDTLYSGSWDRSIKIWQ